MRARGASGKKTKRTLHTWEFKEAFPFHYKCILHLPQKPSVINLNTNCTNRPLLPLPMSCFELWSKTYSHVVHVNVAVPQYKSGAFRILFEPIG